MTDKLCFGFLQEFLRHTFLSKTENLKFGLEINIIDKKKLYRSVNKLILLSWLCIWLSLQVHIYRNKLWLNTLFMKLDLPTLGNPHISNVLVFGSIDGNLDKCCLTCSRYSKLCFCLFIIVHILKHTHNVISKWYTILNHTYNVISKWYTF